MIFVHVVTSQHVGKFSASSFYPNRGQVHPRLNQGNSVLHAPEVDDDGTETEDDPLEDDHTDELALRHPNKFSESLAVEVSP
jgi:hypothetical protein